MCAARRIRDPGHRGSSPEFHEDRAPAARTQPVDRTASSARCLSTPDSTTTKRCPTASSRDLGIPEPDINLGVGSGTHGASDRRGPPIEDRRAARWKPRPGVRVIVVGDVNSTLAATLAAVKLAHSRSDHVEAGLRSFDRKPCPRRSTVS